VRPGGTGIPGRVISATPAPLPPSRSRISLDPSENRYTHLVLDSVSVAMASKFDPDGHSGEEAKPDSVGGRHVSNLLLPGDTSKITLAWPPPAAVSSLMTPGDMQRCGHWLCLE